MVRAHYYKSLQKTETMELFMSYYKHSWVNLSKPIVYSYKENSQKAILYWKSDISKYWEMYIIFVFGRLCGHTVLYLSIVAVF